MRREMFIAAASAQPWGHFSVVCPAEQRSGRGGRGRGVAIVEMTVSSSGLRSKAEASPTLPSPGQAHPRATGGWRRSAAS